MNVVTRDLVREAKSSLHQAIDATSEVLVGNKPEWIPISHDACLHALKMLMDAMSAHARDNVKPGE